MYIDPVTAVGKPILETGRGMLYMIKVRYFLFLFLLGVRACKCLGWQPAHKHTAMKHPQNLPRIARVRVSTTLCG